MLLVVVGAVLAPSAARWAGEKLRATVANRLGAALGRPVAFDAIHLSREGLVLDHARLPGRAGVEARDPLVIERVRVTADWWQLVTARRLRVSAVELEGVDLEVPPDGALFPRRGPPEARWDAPLRTLRDAGVATVRVRRAAVRAHGWAVADATGELSLSPGTSVAPAFRACASASRVTRGADALGALRRACVRGTGAAVELEGLDAELARGGGVLAAHGTLAPSRRDVELVLRLAGAPLAALRAAARAAMPAPKAVGSIAWSDALLVSAGALDTAENWSLTGTLDARATVAVRAGELAGVTVEVALDAPRIARRGAALALEPLRTRVEWTPAGLRIGTTRLATAGAALTAAVTARPSAPAPPRHPPGAAAPWRVETRGALRVERRALAPLRRVLARLAPPRSGLTAAAGRVDLARLAADFDLAAPLDAPARATGTVRLRADALTVRGVTPRGTRPLRFTRVAGTVARRAAGGPVTVRALRADALGAELTGELTLESDQRGAFAPDRVRASGQLRVRDLAVVRRALPSLPVWRWFGPPDARASASAASSLPSSPAPPATALVTFRGGAAGGEAWAEGRVEAGGVRIGEASSQPPGMDLFPLAVTQATAGFRARVRLASLVGAPAPRAGAPAPPPPADAVAVTLTALRGQTSAGVVTRGTLRLDAQRYTLDLTARDVDARIVRRLVPGTLTGGRGDATVGVAGTFAAGDDPTVAGRFDVRDARYALPRELPYAPGALAVSRFAGTYRINGTRIALEQLAMRSDVFEGTGRITVDGAVARVQAWLSTRDLGRAARGWAPLAGVVRGGTGVAHLDLTAAPRGVFATLGIDGAHSTLVLPGLSNDLARHPVARAHVDLHFTPDGVSFTGLSLRGPRGNLDARGESTAAGVLTVRGRAWLTRRATAQLLAPTGFGWLARLFGVRTLASDFTLRSTERSGARLQAAIARSTLWRLASPFIPRPVRDTARGRVPLWGNGAPAPATKPPAARR